MEWAGFYENSSLFFRKIYVTKTAYLFINLRLLHSAGMFFANFPKRDW